MAADDKLPLSVAIITRDEEARLPDCLRSVSFAEDIVVLDSGSTDRTLQISRESGCRVFSEDWKGYGPQKNSAIEKCYHDLVLVLDADERVPTETRDRIAAIVMGGGTADAYSFTRKNFFHGKWMKYGGEWPDWQVRLLRRSRGSYRSTVHEEWVTDGVIEYLDASLEHYSYTDYSGWLRKMEEYSTLSARELYRAGGRPGPLTPAVHAISMFIKTYVLHLGFLGGLDGLAICVVKACGSFFKYAKARELGIK